MPSAQTRFILEAMNSKEKEDMDQWDRMMQKVDRLTEKVMGMDEVQQQLLAQAGLAASVAQQATEERVRLVQLLEKTGREVTKLRLVQMARCWSLVLKRYKSRTRKHNC
jgi:UTP-glucose-1-phosphate uridylyltransferase